VSGLFIPLRVTPGAKGIYLRGLRGADELAIEETDTRNLIHLLDSMMDDGSKPNKIRAAQIVTSDRDRILAALYISLFGPKVASTLSCRNCAEKFDLDFSLHDLLAHSLPTLTQASDNGTYELEPGVSFRLPNGEDEMMINPNISGDGEKQLLERCLIEGNPETDNEKIQVKMAELAPVLNMEMQASCPECGVVQQVQFDMQSFFLMRLKQERHVLLREIHAIASQYHWSQKEILDLPGNVRKQYAALIHAGN